MALRATARLSIVIFMIISLSVLATFGVVAQAQTPATPRVIAIGDSVTDDFGNGGWRGPLRNKLATLGQAITYVGSRSDSAGNHEAYAGASSCDFFTDRGNFMASTYGKSPTWDLRTALAVAQPTIAIVYVGINNYVEDYNLAQGAVSTVPCGLNGGSLHWLLDTVVYDPGITGVVIATIEDSLIPSGTENINTLIRKYVSDRQAQGKNVCLGDLPANFSGLTTDRFHLNTAGKDAVATALVTPTLSAIAGTCASAPTLPMVTIAATIANAAEPATNGQFTVSRTGSTTNPLTVNFTVSGSATPGVDYTNIGTSVTIPAGSNGATIAVNVIDDANFEGDETVIVSLTPQASYTLGVASATITIADNDAAPAGPTVSTSPAGVAQGDAVTVNWAGITSAAALDWLGLFTAGAGNGSYLTWFYVSCSQGAASPKVSGSCVMTIPLTLPNGSYQFRLFSNDSFNLIASSNAFVVGLPAVSIATTANAAEPSSNGQFTLTRSGSTAAPLTVNFAVGGSATAGVDYTSLGNTIVIPAGSASATLAVNVIDDSIYEGNETVTVTLAATANYAVGAAGTATVTIVDNDKPNVSIVATDAAAAEAGPDPGIFTVTRDGVTTAPLAVSYTVGGTATNGIDYQTLNGTVTIPAGQASATIVVTPIDDSLFEGNETVVITLNSSANYVVTASSSATVTIADNDQPVVTIVATDANAAESGLDPAIFTVSRDGITTAPLTVGYSMTGTATNGVDYQFLSGSVTIPAGQTTASIVVTPVDDNLYEGSETVFATLTGSANYVLGNPNSAAATIADNDKPNVSIVATDPAAAETGLDPGIFTVTRDGITTATLTVNYTVSGTATNGVDYQPLSGSLTIPVGQATATVVVTPIDDSAPEGSETVVLTLTPSSSYNLSAPTSASVTIADNDGPSIAASPTTLTRGGTVTVSWSGILSASPADWYALSLIGAPDGSYWSWAYVSCTSAPTIAKVSGSCPFAIPANLPAGTYQLRMYSNNGFTRLATSDPLTLP